MSCTIPTSINVNSLAEDNIGLLAEFSSSLSSIVDVKFNVTEDVYVYATFHTNILSEQARLSHVGIQAEAGVEPFLVCGTSAKAARPFLTVDLTSITMDNAITTIDQNQ